MLKNDNKMVRACAECLECGLCTSKLCHVQSNKVPGRTFTSTVLLELELGVVHSQLSLCLNTSSGNRLSAIVVECDDSYYMDSPPKIK